MHRFAILALASLAGCTTAYQYELPTGPSQNYSSAMRPHALAVCTVSNARGFSDKFGGYVVELVRPENYKVVVRRYTGLTYDPIIVAYTSPVSGGSLLQVFLSDELSPAAASDWIERLRRGCGSDSQTTLLVPVVPVISREALPASTPPPPAVPASPQPSGRQVRN